MTETKQEEEVMEIAYKVCLDIVWECLNVEVGLSYFDFFSRKHFYISFLDPTFFKPNK